MLTPPGATSDAGVLLFTRGLRAVVDGLVAVVLPAYLVVLGFTAGQVGAVVTATLLGSAAATLGVGLRGGHLSRRFVLSAAAITMVLTGLGFTFVSAFWPLLAVAAIGTMNPSSGDVSIFLPSEQALLPATVSAPQRTDLFARYSLVAMVMAAVGSLAAALPGVISRQTALSERQSLGAVFLVYAAVGAVLYVAYQRLHIDATVSRTVSGRAGALGDSRPVVYRLATIFALDSFAGGFVVQSLLVLWLYRRFDLSVGVAGVIFFWAGLLSGTSALVAARLARRIGLIRTMVFTHLPANGFLILTALMPNAPLAVTFLLLRSALSQMDVPARTSYVMAIVAPEHRAAAASVTNVPRSLAAALPPLAAGWMLERTTFGWPLIIGGAGKIAYDLILLSQFGDIRPPEETGPAGVN